MTRCTTATLERSDRRRSLVGSGEDELAFHGQGGGIDGVWKIFSFTCFVSWIWRPPTLVDSNAVLVGGETRGPPRYASGRSVSGAWLIRQRERHRGDRASSPALRTSQRWHSRRGSKSFCLIFCDKWRRKMEWAIILLPAASFGFVTAFDVEARHGRRARVGVRPVFSLHVGLAGPFAFLPGYDAAVISATANFLLTQCLRNIGRQTGAKGENRKSFALCCRKRGETLPRNHHGGLRKSWHHRRNHRAKLSSMSERDPTYPR